MSMRYRRSIAGLAAGAVLAACAAAAPALAQVEGLEIVVPAAAGGGWN